MATETRTYVGETGTQAFDGMAGLRIGQRYTGTLDGELVLVSAVSALPGSGIRLRAEEWERWFVK